jgi:hypothetical protein
VNNPAPVPADLEAKAAKVRLQLYFMVFAVVIFNVFLFLLSLREKPGKTPPATNAPPVTNAAPR